MPFFSSEFSIKKLYYKPKENWFKELLYKLRILKPKLQEIEVKVIDLDVLGRRLLNEIFNILCS